jgi:hypothetical protein
MTLPSDVWRRRNLTKGLKAEPPHGSPDVVPLLSATTIGRGQRTDFGPRRFGALIDVTDAVEFKNRFCFAEPDRLAA